MKLALAILICVSGFALATVDVVTPPGAPVATIGPLVNGSRAITYTGDPSNYLWILEIACRPQGPFELCHEAHYQHGTLTDFMPCPNHFYRLHGLTNDGSYNYF